MPIAEYSPLRETARLVCRGIYIIRCVTSVAACPYGINGRGACDGRCPSHRCRSGGGRCRDADRMNSRHNGGDRGRSHRLWTDGPMCGSRNSAPDGHHDNSHRPQDGCDRTDHGHSGCRYATARHFRPSKAGGRSKKRPDNRCTARGSKTVRSRRLRRAQ